MEPTTSEEDVGSQSKDEISMKGLHSPGPGADAELSAAAYLDSFSSKAARAELAPCSPSFAEDKAILISSAPSHSALKPIEVSASCIIASDSDLKSHKIVPVASGQNVTHDEATVPRDSLSEYERRLAGISAVKVDRKKTQRRLFSNGERSRVGASNSLKASAHKHGRENKAIRQSQLVIPSSSISSVWNARTQTPDHKKAGTTADYEKWMASIDTLFRQYSLTPGKQSHRAHRDVPDAITMSPVPGGDSLRSRGNVGRRPRVSSKPPHSIASQGGLKTGDNERRRVDSQGSSLSSISGGVQEDRRDSKKRARLLHLEQERAQMCTFKPHLPSLRRIERDLHLPSGDVTSRTLTWQSQREERLARLRQEHDDQLRRVCTFQPNADAAWGGRVGEFEDSESEGSQITTVTEGERRKIAAEASERLYYKGMQAKRQKQKMLRRLLETQFAQICPFQPNASQQAPRPDSAPPRVRFRGDDEAPSDGAGSARPDLRGEDGRLRVPLTRPHYMLPRECDAETTEFTTSDRRLMEELEECTFHPRVNGPSKEMGLARLYLSQDAVTRLTQFAKARLSDNVNNTESGLHSHEGSATRRRPLSAPGFRRGERKLRGEEEERGRRGGTERGQSPPRAKPRQRSHSASSSPSSGAGSFTGANSQCSTRWRGAQVASASRCERGRSRERDKRERGRLGPDRAASWLARPPWGGGRGVMLNAPRGQAKRRTRSLDRGMRDRSRGGGVGGGLVQGARGFNGFNGLRTPSPMRVRGGVRGFGDLPSMLMKSPDASGHAMSTETRANVAASDRAFLRRQEEFTKIMEWNLKFLSPGVSASTLRDSRHRRASSADFRRSRRSAARSQLDVSIQNAPKPESGRDETGGQTEAGRNGEDQGRDFLARVEVWKEKHDKELATLAQRAQEALPFSPQINEVSRKREGRTLHDLSTGDAERIKQSRQALRDLLLQEQLSLDKEQSPFKPSLNPDLVTPDGPVGSVLRTASAPDSYLQRIAERRQQQAQKTELLKQSRESAELRECSFQPQTTEAPDFVLRIADKRRLNRNSSSLAELSSTEASTVSSEASGSVGGSSARDQCAGMGWNASVSTTAMQLSTPARHLRKLKREMTALRASRDGPRAVAPRSGSLGYGHGSGRRGEATRRALEFFGSGLRGKESGLDSQSRVGGASGGKNDEESKKGGASPGQWTGRALSSSPPAQALKTSVAAGSALTALGTSSHALHVSPDLEPAYLQGSVVEETTVRPTALSGTRRD